LIDYTGLSSIIPKGYVHNTERITNKPTSPRLKSLYKRNRWPLTVSCAPSGDEGPTVSIVVQILKTLNEIRTHKTIKITINIKTKSKHEINYHNEEKQRNRYVNQKLETKRNQYDRRGIC
jgi:hypothetical protein